MQDTIFDKASALGMSLAWYSTGYTFVSGTFEQMTDRSPQLRNLSANLRHKFFFEILCEEIEKAELCLILPA